jgi:hypothetical protein
MKMQNLMATYVQMIMTAFQDIAETEYAVLAESAVLQLLTALTVVKHHFHVVPTFNVFQLKQHAELPIILAVRHATAETFVMAKETVQMLKPVLNREYFIHLTVATHVQQVVF